MEYTLKINDFEGPLDLLLHLIKEAKMSIFDFLLSINTFCLKYHSFISRDVGVVINSQS